MDQPTQFRSAFNGFNREDVVRYLEYINNKHSAQVAQLSNELDFLRSRQDHSDSGRVAELEQQVKTAVEENDLLHCRVEELETQLQETRNALAASEKTLREGHASAKAAAAPSNAELEAYRRAERVERVAKERARKISDQTMAALAEASKQVDASAEMIGQISRQLTEQLEAAQSAVLSSRQAFQEASGALETLRAELAE